MIDEFASQRLPDLPHAGYSTRREKQLSDAMMFFLRGAERDRPFLLMMVIEGYDLFLTRMRAAWKAFRVTDDEIRQVYQYLQLLSGPNPQEQLAQLIAIQPKVSHFTEQQVQDIARRGQ